MSDIAPVELPAGFEPKSNKCIIQMTLDDAHWYTPEKRALIISEYPEHERAARARGVPILGSGPVFPTRVEDLTCDHFDIPKHWKCIGGLDFGWDHPFAAVELAWDWEADIVYVVKAWRVRQETIAQHVDVLKAWGDLPWAWPHDGHVADKTSGEPTADLYRQKGLDMMPEHSTHETGGHSFEAGIAALRERIVSGRFRVFSHLVDWIEEFRRYHRKDGLVVKTNDDLMSATRIAHMSLRFGRPVERSKWAQPNSRWVT